ncbi:MAG: transcriptional regulator, MarR family [Candidatus Solibacter sp.]|jgi:DNA-binding MarR family transcriptional regulator|nr:transcriptional regulator, MarR family [Candidatus Solibacter sp.]
MMTIDAEALQRSTLHRITTVCIGHRARMAARALTRHYNAQLRPVGLTAGQFGVLVALGTMPGQTVAMLAEASGTDATTMVRGIQQLERRGLVASVGGRGRQSKRSALTKAGARLLKRATPRWEAAYGAIAEEMGEAAMTRAMAALGKLEKAAKAVE